MLTDREMALMDKLGSLVYDFKEMADAVCAERDMLSYNGDYNELCHYIHVLQNWVLANSAAREYPDVFRPFGAVRKDQLPQDATIQSDVSVEKPKTVRKGRKRLV
jgi:hypothetical protein